MVHTEEISELAARLGSASLGELGSSASSSAASLTGRVYGKRQPHKEIPRKVNGGNECHSANDAEGSGSPTPSSTGDAQICFDFTKGACGRGENCRFSHDIATIVNVNSQERGICFDFVRGQCNRGLLCRFSHDLSNLSQHQPRASTSRDRPKSGAICFDFVKGACSRGVDCRFSHDINTIARSYRETAAAGTEICQDYTRGRCTRGAACRYSHDISTPPVPRSRNQEISNRSEKFPTRHAMKSEPHLHRQSVPVSSRGSQADPGISSTLGMIPLLARNISRYADVLNSRRHCQTWQSNPNMLRHLNRPHPNFQPPPPPPPLQETWHQQHSVAHAHVADMGSQCNIIAGQSSHNCSVALGPCAQADGIRISEADVLQNKPVSHRQTCGLTSHILGQTLQDDGSPDMSPGGVLRANEDPTAYSNLRQHASVLKNSMIQQPLPLPYHDPAQPHIVQFQNLPAATHLARGHRTSQLHVQGQAPPPPPPPRQQQQQRYKQAATSLADGQKTHSFPAATLQTLQSSNLPQAGHTVAAFQVNGMEQFPALQPPYSSIPSAWGTSSTSASGMNQNTLGQLRQIWNRT